MSPWLARAVIASEDARFCMHHGFDYEEIGAALERFRAGGKLRGASTISQQTAKNILLWPGGGFLRKGIEAYVTELLELGWPKSRILEVYLNVVEWGDGVYGAEAAARRYFGKAASALDADEAAGLAGMIPSPRRINPRVNAAAFARAQRRVVWLMAHAGYLSRSGLGAEPPPPEPAFEDEPAMAEPETSAPVEGAPPPEPERPASPEPSASPV